MQAFSSSYNFAAKTHNNFEQLRQFTNIFISGFWKYQKKCVTLRKICILIQKNHETTKYFPRYIKKKKARSRGTGLEYLILYSLRLLELECRCDGLYLTREGLNQHGALLEQLVEVAYYLIIVVKVFFRHVPVHALSLCLALEGKSQTWLILILRTLLDGEQCTLSCNISRLLINGEKINDL